VRRRAKAIPFFVGVVALTTIAPALLSQAVARGAAADNSINARLADLGNPLFDDSSFGVVPGTTVTLDWSGGATSLLDSGVHLVVTSSLPGFSLTSVVKWPSHTPSAPRWDGTGWVTRTTGMSVAIPSDATPGTQYQFGIQACTSTDCINPAKTVSLSVPPSPTDWVMTPYRTDFSKVATFPAPGSPFATAFLASNDSIWSASEDSHDVTEVPSTATNKAKVLAVPDPSGTPSTFRHPFAWCDATKCEPSSKSALSEQVTTSNGWIWTTFGGWRVYANGERDSGSDAAGQPSAVRRQSMPPNRSEVVAFDPTTNRSCTYLVPGDNTQVAGITAIGAAPHTQIWFVASYGPSGEGSLDEFNPSTVGGGCTGRADKDYVLPTSVTRLTWPSSGAQWPVQVAADPSSQTLWISDFNPFTLTGQANSGIDLVNISDPAHPTFVHRYVYPTVNVSTYFGAKPWDLVAPANSDYVYAIDNGDAEIVRIDKVTNQLQELPIPLTTDLENAFGLAISSGRLYFALADDYSPKQLPFGAASTFGYVDLSTWTAGAPPKSGVIYTGLNPVTDPGGWADYRAIAVGQNGQIALSDSSGIVRLTP
jgi:hypothetical protein